MALFPRWPLGPLLPDPHQLFAHSIKLLCLVTALAGAAIIYSGLRNIPIPTNQGGVHLDLATGTASGVLLSGWEFNPFFGGVALSANASFQPARVEMGNEEPIRMLLPGTPSDDSLNFSAAETGSSTHLGAPGNFQSGIEGRWTHENSLNPVYGWMRLTLTENTPGAVIHDWAYETTGAPIQTSQIPEPSAAFLLLGATGLLASRRRRNNAPD